MYLIRRRRQEILRRASPGSTKDQGTFCVALLSPEMEEDSDSVRRLGHLTSGIYRQDRTRTTAVTLFSRQGKIALIRLTMKRNWRAIPQFTIKFTNGTGTRRSSVLKKLLIVKRGDRYGKWKPSGR
ncbi:uncharacterized protein LOC143180788 [Calliopsis andreniformis]|uniref:uncharacterized protein LOC143180788 n=1 Tax=Calliopsis andreniformis TaxID=337506 RepID=UPI003FCC9AC7